jgi:hypothetical protein
MHPNTSAAARHAFALAAQLAEGRAGHDIGVGLVCDWLCETTGLWRFN